MFCGRLRLAHSHLKRRKTVSERELDSSAKDQSQEPLEAIELTEAESAQYEALQKVRGFDELDEYIDAYSKPGLIDHIISYTILESENDGYDHLLGINTQTENLKKVITKIFKQKKYREEHMKIIPKELRPVVKRLVEQAEEEYEPLFPEKK